MKKQTPIKVVFDKKYSEEILSVLGKTVEKKTLKIVDSITKEPVETQEGFELTLSELGAVKIGSQIFFKNDVISVLKLYEALEKNGTPNT